MTIAFDSLEPRSLFSAGQVDTTFGDGDGSVDVRLSAKDWAVNQQDNFVDDKGRTVIASLYRTHAQIGLTRLTADGAVDTSFGTNGIAMIDTGFNVRARGPFQVTVDHAGKVLVMFKNRVTRLYETGGVDKLFGTAGSIAMPMFSDVGDLTVDAKNRPVVMGTSQGKTGTRATVVRFGTRGVVDGSFGSNGVYKAPVPTYARTGNAGNGRGTTLKLLGDGKVISVSNFSAVSSPEETYKVESGVIAFRLDVHGALDANFGPRNSGGFARSSGVSDEYTFVSSSVEALAPDGSVILGTPYSNEHGSGDYFRYKTWSRISTNGIVESLPFEGLVDNFERDDDPTIFPTYYTRVTAVQPNGKFLIQYNGTLVRFNAKYTRDINFPETMLSGAPIVAGNRLLLLGSIEGESSPAVARVTAISL